MNKFIKLLMATLLVSGGLMLSSCSSSPSDEEKGRLTQLEDMVKQLEGQVKTKQGEKANLEKQIAEKNGKIQQCQSDQEAVKKAMGGQ